MISGCYNSSGTSFLASASDFTVSSSSSQISHSFTSLSTSIVVSFLGFFLFSFSFFYPFSSHLFLFSSLSSFFFCFCQPDFLCFDLHCFPYSSEHLVIFTSPVLQSISRLWYASHSILKLTFYFCPSITSISVLFLCS